MKRDIDDFFDEITFNFSELFLETFLVRYFEDYNKSELLKNLPKLRKKLIKNIDKKFEKTLISMGYDKIELKNLFNKKED